MKNNIKIKIAQYEWTVRFLPQRQMRNDNEYGTCFILERAIDVLDTLGREGASLILAHEISHAMLNVYGNTHQSSYDEEFLCDFISWNVDEIVRLRDYVIGQRFGK